MIKISRVDAYAGMDEVDFEIYDQECYIMNNWAVENKKPLDIQFYLSNDGKDIWLHFESNGEVKHKVRFDNKGELTRRAKEELEEIGRYGLTKRQMQKLVTDLKKRTTDSEEKELYTDLSHKIMFDELSESEIKLINNLYADPNEEAKNKAHFESDQELKESGNHTIEETEVTKELKLTLPNKVWKRIEQAQEASSYKSEEAMIREILTFYFFSTALDKE